MFGKFILLITAKLQALDYHLYDVRRIFKILSVHFVV